MLEGSDNDAVFLIDNGGMPQTDFPRTDADFQILSRNRSRVIAAQWADEIFSVTRGRFGGIVLPAVVINGKSYDSIKIWGFDPAARPGYTGTDDNKRHIYSYNFTVVIGG